MSRKSDTTYTWACDLCKAELTSRQQIMPPDLGELTGTLAQNGVKYGLTVTDVCSGCLSRPISDLMLAFMENKHEW